VLNTFRNEETDILPELDKFGYIYIIAGKEVCNADCVPRKDDQR
jgi:hypothetical protein